MNGKVDLHLGQQCLEQQCWGLASAAADADAQHGGGTLGACDAWRK